MGVRLDDRRVPWLISGVGVAIGLVILAETAIYVGFGLRDVTDPAFLVGTGSSLPFVLGIAYAGYWLHRSEHPPRRYGRIVGWFFAGLVGFFVLNVALVVARPPGSTLQIFAWLRWAVALGAGVGLAIGLAEARVIEKAIEAERAELRTQHVAEQRDLLDYLNSVLRHEILNSSTAIDGYASRVLEEEEHLTADGRRWLEIVIDESQDMSRVIQDVRTLMWRTSGDHELHPVDLVEILQSEVRTLTHEWTDATVETSIDDDLFVRADDMLPRVFGNLLANAVEHNDSPKPHVQVEASQRGDVVRVEIADDGPGIPDDELERLWERTPSEGTSHGLGLYLVAELADSYDGSVELVETGEDGTRFAVELQAASAPADEERAEPVSA